MIERLRAHYGFGRTPFGRDLAPGMLHPHRGHAEAVARIAWLIAARAAVAALDPVRHTIVYLPNPLIGQRGLYAEIVRALGGTPRFYKAGLVAQAAELLAAEDTEKAKTSVLIIDEAHLLSAEQLEEAATANQDLKIATLAWEAGRGLVIVVNKWDLKEKEAKTASTFQKEAVEKAPYLRFVPFLFTSATTGQRVQKVLDLIMQVEQERKKRISTSEVTERLEQLVARRQPPQAAGREVKLLYATQVEVDPPTFAVFGNHPELVEEHYVRYLHNGFREAWGFTGTPLRILLRRKAA